MKNRKLPRISNVAVLPPSRLVLEFDDGSVVLVDMEPVASKGGVFERLKDERYFRRVRISNGGRSLAWPERLDFCADAFYVKLPARRKHVTNAFGAQVFGPSAEVVAA